MPLFYGLYCLVVAVIVAVRPAELSTIVATALMVAAILLVIPEEE